MDGSFVATGQLKSDFPVKKCNDLTCGEGLDDIARTGQWNGVSNVKFDVTGAAFSVAYGSNAFGRCGECVGGWTV